MRLSFCRQLSGQTYSSSCLLFKLPREILLQISQHALPINQVMLALSCKWMLAASKLWHLRVPDRSHHVARGYLEPEKPEGHSCSCSLTRDLLRRFRPVDAQGRVSRAWSWCLDCNAYRPKRKLYWSDLLREMNTQDWNDTDYKLWDSAVNLYSAEYKRQCPPCSKREAELRAADR